MKTNSNTYTIIYSAIIVVIVAFLLAFVSQALKAKQDANVALDVKKQILNSLNIRGLGDADAEAKYSEVVKSEELRPPALVPKSRTLRLGRRSSRVRKSTAMTILISSSA